MTEYLTLTPGGIRVSRSRRGKVGKAGDCEAVQPGPGGAAEALRAAAARVRSTGRGGREIKGFSRASRSNMRWRMHSLPWEDLDPGRMAMLSLTYPVEFSLDGAEANRHRRAFCERWRRKYGQPRAVWAREFQERGAPHFHHFIEMPPGAGDEMEQEYGLKAGTFAWPWAAKVWSQIVGTDEAVGWSSAAVAKSAAWHRRIGVNVRPCFYGDARKNGAQVCDYFWKESGKWAQKTPPEGYENLGRYWGYVGLEPCEYVMEMTWGQFCELRRPLRAWRDKRVGRKVRSRRSTDGLYVVGIDGLGDGVRLVRWMETLAQDVERGE